MKSDFLPLVSIITPTFNHELYIAKCIDSVIAQTYQNWEMLILDDGSTDHTSSIAKEYSQKDNRISYFYQPNKGLDRLNESYNFLLQKSKGKYIAILESDDYWYEHKLEVQVESMEQNSNLVFCWSRVSVWIDDVRHLIDYPRCFKESKMDFYSNKPLGSIFNMLFEDFPVPLSWLINKEVLRNIGGFHQTFGMPTVDLNTLLLLSKTGEFKYINESLGVYRRQFNQATSLRIIDIAKSKEYIMLHFYNGLTTEEKERIKFTQYQVRSKLISNRILTFSKQGRSFLIQKKFQEARNSYFESLKIKGSLALGWRIRSLIGLFFSFFKMDVEGLARFVGKSSIK